jgi:uroporphyrinogen decarboxylase
MYSNIPIHQPHPDCKAFIKHLLGNKRIPVPPLVEYNIDDSHIKRITTELLDRKWVDWSSERASQTAYLDNFSQVWYRMGYDFVRFEQSLRFEGKRIIGEERSWVDQHKGAIQNQEDFDHYNWPTVEDFDFFAYEYLNAHLPDGMGFIVSHAGGIFEHLSQIMSFEGLCYALVDQRDLVEAIVAKIGELTTKFYEHILDLDRVIALWPGDDMGYRSGTMISPADLRNLILPWHKKFAGMAHDRQLPYFLHSCGNLADIMADLIYKVAIDGKHSFEDAIIPVEDFHRQYGKQIAVLGGVDINILASGSPDDVRNRTRNLIEQCGPAGRFAIGSGNSIPDYVPVKNYLAMIDECHKIANADRH